MQHSEIHGLLLSAGLGTRLRPLSETWPKCLMPIGDRPLLEFWLGAMFRAEMVGVVVNMHHHADIVAAFLARPRFAGLVVPVYEPRLLGTAGTLRSQRARFQEGLVLVAHADNWCQCDLRQFIHFHLHRRPPGCAITMMTFDADNPCDCGIVETDSSGVVQAFHEKVTAPPSRLANAAVYLLEKEVLDWLAANPAVTDFSTQLLPAWLGRIATWHHGGILRDIGTVSSLLKARLDPRPSLAWPESDDWQRWFDVHPIHGVLADLERAMGSA